MMRKKFTVQLIDDGLDKERRFAGALLHAEVLSALGDVGAALKQYDEAAKKAATRAACHPDYVN